jgi:hypothetical protein
MPLFVYSSLGWCYEKLSVIMPHAAWMAYREAVRGYVICVRKQCRIHSQREMHDRRVTRHVSICVLLFIANKTGRLKSQRRETFNAFLLIEVSEHDIIITNVVPKREERSPTAPKSDRPCCLFRRTSTPALSCESQGHVN